MKMVSVAAVAENGVIGDDGELPWPSIPADKRQYRERVAGSPVVLGRRTFESMRENLPGSTQVVLSRSERSFEETSAHHASGADEAVETAETLDAETVYVLGGAGIYDLFQPRVDRMVLSRVSGEYEGDSHYPDWNTAEWELIDRTEHDRFALEEWRRR